MILMYYTCFGSALPIWFFGISSWGTSCYPWFEAFCIQLDSFHYLFSLLLEHLPCHQVLHITFLSSGLHKYTLLPLGTGKYLTQVCFSLREAIKCYVVVANHVILGVKILTLAYLISDRNYVWLWINLVMDWVVFIVCCTIQIFPISIIMRLLQCAVYRIQKICDHHSILTSPTALYRGLLLVITYTTPSSATWLIIVSINLWMYVASCTWLEASSDFYKKML